MHKELQKINDLKTFAKKLLPYQDTNLVDVLMMEGRVVPFTTYLEFAIGGETNGDFIVGGKSFCLMQGNGDCLCLSVWNIVDSEERSIEQLYGTYSIKSSEELLSLIENSIQ